MVKFPDSDDHPEEALTQDPPDDDELPPGDDHPEEGRAAAGAEGNYYDECNEQSIQIDLNNICFICTSMVFYLIVVFFRL